MSATPSLPPTDRFAAIIARLADCVAAQGRLKRLAGTLLVAIWTRLHRMSARFAAVAATPVPPPRPERPAPAPHPASPRPTRAPHRPPTMPHGARWLIRLLPDTAASLSQLEALLREPEMAALLADDPRLGRILRPLCWALGVDRRLAPPARKRRKPPAPEPPPTEPDQVLAAVAPAAPRPPRAPINFGARDLLTQLRMGPSPFWA